MRKHRDTVAIWSVAVGLALLLVVIVAASASAHRPVSGPRAQQLATAFVAANYCGHRQNFVCQDATTVPLQVGFHSYWWRSTFSEARCRPWLIGRICWAYQWHWSQGWVNGHTGQVIGGGEW